MPFVAPALASPLPDGFDPGHAGTWAAEEKHDGHRLVVAIGDPDAGQRALFADGRAVRAWSRDAKSRILPSHVRDALAQLPEGVYDGELMVPGKRSYGVTELANQADLRYVIFDLLHLLGRDLTSAGTTPCTWAERREMLEALVAARPTLIGSYDDLCVRPTITGPALRLSAARSIDDASQIAALAADVWARDGEGLILKRQASLYQVGKRTKDWLKVKKLQSAVLTLIGYIAGRMGPHAVWALRDDEGQETQVKWKNLEILRAVDADPAAFLGRRVRIEFQERTPDGGYRHPRFDRWEDQ